MMDAVTDLPGSKILRSVASDAALRCSCNLGDHHHRCRLRGSTEFSREINTTHPNKRGFRIPLWAPNCVIPRDSGDTILNWGRIQT